MSTPTITWSPPLPEAAGFEHSVVETPGLRTHLAAIGEGDPVLMLHGFPQHWWQWRDIAPALAAGGHRVLCPDLRGAGWTVASDPQIGRVTRLDDVLALLDSLGLEGVDLVSHDQGAVTAWQLMYGHPDRIRSSVLLSIPPPIMRFHPKAAPGFRHMPRFIWHRTGGSLRWLFTPAYAARPMTDETIETHLAPMSIPAVEAAVRPLTRNFVVPEAMRMASGAYRRQHLRVPTLVVFGRKDWPFTEELLSRTCRNPDGRHADRLEFAYVDDAAHYITDDAPAEVAELVLGWIGEGHREPRG